MKASYSNRLAMSQLVVLTLAKYEAAFKDLPALVTASKEVTDTVKTIEKLHQDREQLRRTGIATEKAHALIRLGDCAYEIASATLACATARGNDTLAGQIDFARSEITFGRDAAILNRVRAIYAAAEAHLASLGEYGVTAAKVSDLQKKIAEFEAVKSLPRQSRTESAAVTRQLPRLFIRMSALYRRRLDRLVVQFRESNPDFYNAYQTARVTVNNRGGRSATPAAPVVTLSEVKKAA